MKKKLIFAAAAIAMLASCSQNDLEAPVVGQTQQSDAIEFGTYLGKQATSRAGVKGAINTNENLQTSGFGLFAYHSDNGEYGSTSAPNFMWNQSVTYSSGWTYTPTKYWPNETSTTNNEQQGSKSAGADRLTFFAYAPYVNPATNGTFTPAETSGITSLTSNSTPGDPKIGYTVAGDLDDAVDLLWGVIPTADPDPVWSNVTGTDMTSSTTPAFTEGFPYLNLLKPNTGQVVDFLFRHALAKLSVGVQLVNDKVDPSSNTFDNTNTKVFIKSITITSKTTNGFGTSGTLNLNNTTANVPLWESVNKTTATNLVADETGEINSALFWSSPSTSDNKNTQFALAGVTETLKNIVTGNAPAATDKAWLVVPTNSQNDFTVNIDYFVMTKDTNLDGGYSIVENNITKDISVPSPGFKGSYYYNIKLLLGMTSVKVNATVQAWEDGTPVEVDLPMNVAP